MRFLAIPLLLLAGCTDVHYPRFFGSRGELPPETSQDPLFKTLDRVLAGSVQVYALNSEGQGISKGSGVVVGVGKYLTARHMTEAASSWVVKLGARNVPARCIAKGGGPFDDWALLESERGLGEAVPVLDHGRPLPGAFTQAVAVGYGLGYSDPTVTVGHLQVVGTQYIRFSAPITFGNSGGGLYTLIDGELTLVAITVAVGVGGGNAVEHMGVGVPIPLIRKQGGLR